MANDEVHRRHPVWTDGAGDGAHGRRYRSGFVAGAQWASTHSSIQLEQAQAELARAEQRLAAALELAEFVTAADHRLETGGAREQLVQKIADVIDNAPILTWREGESVVRDPSSTARELLNTIIASFVVEADDAQMWFSVELPAKDIRRNQLVDWAVAKQLLVANEGKWGLVVENIASSTITQLRAGSYRQFRGEELSNFEFATRKPAVTSTPYPPGRSDLWGRYVKYDESLSNLAPMS